MFSLTGPVGEALGQNVFPCLHSSAQKTVPGLPNRIAKELVLVSVSGHALWRTRG